VKPRTKIALPLFELSGLLALLLIGWVAFSLYELTPGVDENRERLAELRDAFFHIGDSVQTNFTQLDDALIGVVQSKDALAMEQFQNHSQAWKQWLGRETRLANRKEPETGNSNQPGYRRGTRVTNQLDLVRRKLLNDVEDASTNYLRAARYLITNAGQPWIRSRLTEREQVVQNQRSNLLFLAQQARTRGKEIALLLSDQGGWSRELRNRFQHLRLVLLLAVVGLCFLFLFGLYRRKQAETRSVLRQHSEQQARLDKLAYFSSRLAQEHAHEIKQPLTAINARLYTLQKTLAAGSAAHKDAAVIRSEITRLDQIVEKFLQQARPTEPELVELAAEQVLGEVRDLMASQLEQQAIEFRYEVEREVVFRADPQQLKQVLINLVKNAAESISPREIERPVAPGPAPGVISRGESREIEHPVAPGGSAGCISQGERQGVVILRAKKGTRQLKGKADAVAIIEVEDTGAGIPSELQGKIFDPFFTTKKRGSGLGLAIAARIIEQHGGRLEFDTRAGQGTIFRIVLPAARKEPTA